MSRMAMTINSLDRCATLRSSMRSLTEHGRSPSLSSPIWRCGFIWYNVAGIVSGRGSIDAAMTPPFRMPFVTPSPFRAFAPTRGCASSRRLCPIEVRPSHGAWYG